uniref:Uncharacterized protein n=1 Tax=Arundo donax TaxID=35708 RepID=A0A0A8Y919_ARUDO
MCLMSPLGSQVVFGSPSHVHRASFSSLVCCIFSFVFSPIVWASFVTCLETVPYGSINFETMTSVRIIFMFHDLPKEAFPILFPNDCQTRE